MYRAFFGLREKPFNLTPDPKFLYLNASYREALAALHYGVVDRKGFVSLIGEAGTGKTTLLRRLLSELPRETRSVLVINPAIGFEEMLRFILTDLGRAPAPGASKLDMLEALNSELLDTLARGGNVVVLIDEAQDLTIPLLEELRLLSNLETAKEKILQLVLAGQPEFDELLSRPEIRQLLQRISVRARLRPLARAEVKSYVAARIKAAGGDVRGLFTPAALFRLWWFSGGVPRLVNAACDNALVNAYAAGRRTIGWKDVGEAMRDLRRQVTWAPRRLTRLLTVLLAAVAGGGLVLGGLWLVGARGPRALAPVAALPTSAPSPSPHSSPSPVPSETVSPAESPQGAIASPDPGGLANPADPAVSGHGAPPVVAAPPDEPLATRVAATVTVSPNPEITPEPAMTATVVQPTRARSPRPRSSPRAGAGDLPVHVSEGDTLTDLAQRYYGNTGPRTLAAIRAANPWLGDPDVLTVGQTLILPAPRLEGPGSPAASGSSDGAVGSPVSDQ